MAIIAAMMTLVVPAISTVVAGKGISRALTNYSGALELAKSTALSRNTYVWVGFANNVDSTTGNMRSCLGMMMSRDGTASTAPANLSPLGKLVSTEGTAYSNLNQLSSNLQTMATAAFLTEAGANKYSVNLNNGTSFVPALSYVLGGVTFNEDFMIFTPQGEIVTTPTADSFVTQTMVGITQARGSVALAPTVAKDGVIIVVYGGTGQLRVVRP